MGLSENIKKYRKLNKMTQTDLAKKLGVGTSTVSSWELGSNKPLMDNVTKMANLWNIRMSDIVGDGGQANFPNNLVRVRNGDFIEVPILGEIACGDPILAEENIIGYRYHLKDTLPKGNTFYLKAKGDSMEPRIPNGADVLIRQQNDVENGEIAAVLVNGDTEATLKRVYRQGTNISLVAENPAYPPYIVNKDNPAKILGKAIEVSFDL